MPKDRTKWLKIKEEKKKEKPEPMDDLDIAVIRKEFQYKNDYYVPKKKGQEKK